METKIQVREVQIKYKGRKHISSDIIRSPEAVSKLFHSILPNNVQEHFVAVYLDGSHTPIGYSVVHTGTANQSVVHPRDVFQRAVMLGSVSIVVGHNHPSGNLDLSAEDVQITEKLKDAGKILGIKVLDHLVLGNTPKDYYSFQEHGRI